MECLSISYYFSCQLEESNTNFYQYSIKYITKVRMDKTIFEAEFFNWFSTQTCTKAPIAAFQTVDQYPEEVFI